MNGLVAGATLVSGVAAYGLGHRWSHDASSENDRAGSILGPAGLAAMVIGELGAMNALSPVLEARLGVGPIRAGFAAWGIVAAATCLLLIGGNEIATRGIGSEHASPAVVGGIAGGVVGAALGAALGRHRPAAGSVDG